MVDSRRSPSGPKSIIFAANATLAMTGISTPGAGAFTVAVPEAQVGDRPQINSVLQIPGGVVLGGARVVDTAGTVQVYVSSFVAAGASFPIAVTLLRP